MLSTLISSPTDLVFCQVFLTTDGDTVRMVCLLVEVDGVTIPRHVWSFWTDNGK